MIYFDRFFSEFATISTIADQFPPSSPDGILILVAEPPD